jgi:CxxC motif-containing protein (DUF1111 family)
LPSAEDVSAIETPPVEPPQALPKDPVSLGRELFARQWRPNDPRCHGGDGLGPVYNATSCVDCHSLGGPGGAGPAERNVELVTGIGYAVSPDKSVEVNGNTFEGNIGLDMIGANPDRADLVKLHPAFQSARSAVLHRFGVDPAYNRWRENLRPQVRDKLNRAKTVIDPVSWGMTAPAGSSDADALLTVSSRNPTPLFGAGQIDALPAATIEATARRQPSGIKGRVHRMTDGRIGRFGWKAQVASLEDFVQTACANELGLENPGHHQAASPLAPTARAKGLDLTWDECDALVSYVRSLPAPVERTPSETADARVVEEGSKLFERIGCAGCHVPNLGSIRGIYGDLLLHKMGEDMRGRGQYYPNVAIDVGSADTPKDEEWRTPPLWGVADSGPYMHDGRAKTLDEAISMHGGQADASMRTFRKLSATDRSRVLRFLGSLVAPGSPE